MILPDPSGLSRQKRTRYDNTKNVSGTIIFGRQYGFPKGLLIVTTLEKAGSRAKQVHRREVRPASACSSEVGVWCTVGPPTPRGVIEPHRGQIDHHLPQLGQLIIYGSRSVSSPADFLGQVAQGLHTSICPAQKKTSDTAVRDHAGLFITRGARAQPYARHRDCTVRLSSKLCCRSFQWE